MEGTPRDDRESAPLDADPADVVPGHVAATLARLDAVLDELQGLAWSPLAAGEVRATLRAVTAGQSRLASVGFAGLVAIDARDDVVPRARSGQASVTFQERALGIDHATAKRDSTAARLLDPDTGDLKVMGTAFAAGTVLRGHVEVAVRTHRDLGATLREEIVPLDIDPETGELPEGCRYGRRIEAMDDLLARESRHFGVEDLGRFARDLVDELNPKTPAGAHERRYLCASPDSNGNLVGKFACGATQGALILAVLAAWNAPRPGLAIDQDGVEHVLRDDRDLGQRNMDALTDCLAVGAARAGIPLPERAGTRPDPEPWPDTFGVPDQDQTDDQADERADQQQEQQPEPQEQQQPEPPAAEGEYTVIREPGVWSGPYPPVKILVTVSIEHLAQALARTCKPGNDPGALWNFGTSPPDPPPEPLSDVVERLGGQAWIQHVGRPPDATLVELVAGARLQRVLHTRDGAVLAMGRTVRLATPAQKDALIARDLTCVIPGCTVPGEHCQVHHVTPWAAGGPTDLDNMTLLCVRHHTETGQGTWEIGMINGVPWVRVPSWIDRNRPLLRNRSG